MSESFSFVIISQGVHHPEDALLAIRHGLSGIIVSNHGARQVDTVPASIEMLPGIVQAVQERMPVYFDGGVRRYDNVNYYSISSSKMQYKHHGGNPCQAGQELTPD